MKNALCLTRVIYFSFQKIPSRQITLIFSYWDRNNSCPAIPCTVHWLQRFHYNQCLISTPFLSQYYIYNERPGGSLSKTLPPLKRWRLFLLPDFHGLVKADLLWKHKNIKRQVKKRSHISFLNFWNSGTNCVLKFDKRRGEIKSVEVQFKIW